MKKSGAGLGIYVLVVGKVRCGEMKMDIERRARWRSHQYGRVQVPVVGDSLFIVSSSILMWKERREKRTFCRKDSSQKKENEKEGGCLCSPSVYDLLMKACLCSYWRNYM